MDAPGVIVEELGGVATAVMRGSTVPVFIGNFALPSGSHGTPETFFVKISNFTDLLTHFPNSLVFNFSVTNGSISIQYSNYTVAPYFKSYFEQGGGPCYLLAYANGQSVDYASYIKRHEEISLLVPTHPPTSAYAALFSNLTDNLLKLDSGYFMLAAVKTPSELAEIIEINNSNTALYLPVMRKQYQHWRNDAFISVAGHKDADTLEKLKSVDPSLYAEADSLIKEKQKELSILPFSAVYAAAAAIVKTDRERGTWKSPANLVIDNAEPEVTVTPSEQADLNEKGINVIRKINGQTTIWGARTCDTTNRQWRYITVRRLFNQVQRDVTLMLRGFVDSPNNQSTWTRAKGAIENYLYNIWQLGGLQGSRPEDGYHVLIDPTTMSQADIDGGRLIAHIALAASRPAEFIILQVSQKI